MNEDNKPIWVREKFIVKRFGLSRSILRAMREHGLIVSVSLRNDDRKHGALLFKMSSLVHYMESLRDTHGRRFMAAKHLAGFGGEGWRETLPVMGTAKLVSERLGLTRSILRRLREEHLVTPIPVAAPGSRSKILLYSTGSIMDLLEGLAEKQMEQSRQRRPLSNSLNPIRF